MSIYQPKPTYYRITWTLDSPTDYTGSGATAGGISPLSSIDYKNSVVLSGNVSAPTMTTGDELLLNNVVIGPFDSGDTVADIVERFNVMLPYTSVMASENWTGYVTLQSLNPTDSPILLEEKVGTPCADMGLPTGVFNLSNPIYGGTFTTLTNGQTIILNGITVTFVTGGLDIAGACAKINLSTNLHNVVATPWTDKIQLNSLDGSPIFFGSPGSGTATANLGFAINTAYGGAMDLADAKIIERGALRWKGVINSIETGLTAFTYGTIVMAGSTTDGNSPPTTVSWTLGVENVDHVYCVTESGEPETVGTILNGSDAIKRLVARALTRPWMENRNVFNNTLTVRGGFALRENQIIVEHIVADPLDTVSNIATLEDNITVSMIPYA